ncbi:MAG: hypothetical protein KDK36_04805, partial [Leptospiraceae bacterium]|nr:hypothetical protein [Leptospiraceae bacterium]
MNYKKFLTINIFAFLIGCSSSDLLQRDDYLQVKNQLIGNENPELALKRFPSKERGAFITSMEKAYLSILSGTPYLKDLLYHSELSKKRLRFSASREVQSLFYLETPEGYYASEHEIIWMHILLGWGFAIQGEYEKTCVEARAG